MKTFIVLSLILCACSPAVDQESKAPDDLIYVSHGYAARACLVPANASQVTNCKAYADPSEYDAAYSTEVDEHGDTYFTCPEVTDFDGELGCCRVGPDYNEMTTWYWFACEVQS